MKTVTSWTVGSSRLRRLLFPRPPGEAPLVLDHTKDLKVTRTVMDTETRGQMEDIPISTAIATEVITREDRHGAGTAIIHLPTPGCRPVQILDYLRDHLCRSVAMMTFQTIAIENDCLGRHVVDLLAQAPAPPTSILTFLVTMEHHLSMGETGRLGMTVCPERIVADAMIGTNGDMIENGLTV